ncbi:cathepsin O [Myxocyprinus asiaticus]|uniref:cathepsin O n=1 Tax=Myxocyprinus asiaticus TaxID=70543 RepID=UPI0022238D1A|nr:cathepsin O [Myxocyprinus asiaticus]
MAFTSTFVGLILCHGLLHWSNSVELMKRNQTEGGQRFMSFQQQYGRIYSNEELSEGRIHFQNSIKRHALLNSVLKKSNNSARYGINQFSDLSPKQFKERYLTVQAEAAPKFDINRPGIHVKTSYPPRFDWRDSGVVGPVQNQKGCGGCWAFSVVGAIESVSAKEGGKLQQLSVQQVIDCSYNNQGCNGGSPDEALYWLTQTKLKLVNQAEYPYKAVAGICQYFPQSHDGVVVKNYSAHDFRTHEEEMMSILVEHGPLVVIVDAISWQDYLGGIIQHHCSSHNANHAVLITGYDTTGEVPYWIVRNSWGTSWGDSGYVYIKKGDNMCGIAENVAAVFV